MNTSRIHPPVAGAFGRPVSARRVEALVPDGAQDRNWFRIENKEDAPDEADIYIYDEIGFWGTTAAQFVREIKDLDVSNITLHLNSPGGEVFDGTAIYNSLVSHRARVRVLVDGLAASAASFIAQAGDEIVMGQGSMMMIHDASGMSWGNADETRGVADLLDKISDNIASIYSANAGGTASEWREIMKLEAWYTAEEAVEVGLATSVSKKAVQKSPENQWNLSVFNHAGRSQAPDPNKVRESARARVKESTMGQKPILVNGPVTGAVTGSTQVENAPEVEEVVAPVEPLSEHEEVEEVVAPVEVEEEDEVLPQEVSNVTNLAKQDGTFGIVVNGVRTTDQAAIQAHVAGLEAFASDVRAGARVDFVAELVKDGKLLAAQEESVLAHAKALTAEQYETFTAMWNVAPQVPLLGKHVGGTNSDTVSSTTGERIAILQDTIAHHKAAGKKDDFIKSTATFKELEGLLAEQAS